MYLIHYNFYFLFIFIIYKILTFLTVKYLNVYRFIINKFFTKILMITLLYNLCYIYTLTFDVFFAFASYKNLLLWMYLLSYFYVLIYSSVNYRFKYFFFLTLPYYYQLFLLCFYTTIWLHF